MVWWEERRRYTAGYIAVWSDPPGPTRIVKIALATAIGHFLAVVLFMHTGLPAVLAVPLAAVFGPAGVWGVALGAGVGHLSTSGIGILPFSAFCGAFLGAFLGRTMWLQLAYPYRRRPEIAAVAILPVALIGTLVASGVTAAGVALSSDIGFAAFLPVSLADQLLLTSVLGPVIVVGASRWRKNPVTGMKIGLDRWIATVLVVGLVITTWLVAAVLIDLWRAEVQAQPELQDTLFERIPTVIELMLHFASGPWGWSLQFLLATLAGISIAWVIASAGDGSITRPHIRFFGGNRDPDR